METTDLPNRPFITVAQYIWDIQHNDDYKMENDMSRNDSNMDHCLTKTD